MAYGLLESIDRNTQIAGHNRVALLLFRLGPRQLFGINVFKVQEVLRQPLLSSLPGVHRHVHGVAEIRGRIVPVINLAAAIDVEPPQAGQLAHVIVAEFNRTVQAFSVGAVERIVHVDVAQIEPPPQASGEGHLTAITRFQDQLVEIIDVEKVLADVVGGGGDFTADRPEDAARLAAGRKVAVVDDSRVARAQIERTLTHLGLSFVSFADGREALAQLQRMAESGPIESQLAMVISDIEMPHMDGYTLTTEIRRDPRLKGLYVMLHTSLSGVFNNAMVQRVGADRFIAKFNPNELADGVLGHLRQEAPLAA